MKPAPTHSQLTACIVAVVWTLWLIGMASWDLWGHLREGWIMSLTMAFGSFVAGATSEGGGAVAFPVMTLVLGIAPSLARDFSLCIQAIGMTAASIVIWKTRTPIVRSVLPSAIIAGAIGLMLGLELLAPRLPPPMAKLLFTSVWLAFGASLLVAQRNPRRRSPDEPYAPNLLVIAPIALIGGAVVSVTGSGLDICLFSYLVLRGRVSESVATPTSVMLMASNAIVGALYRAFAMKGLPAEVWTWWWACVPVVVVGAPFGAWFIQRVRRESVVALLLASIVVQYVAAVLILPMSPNRWLFSAGVFACGLVVFGVASLPSKSGDRGVPAPPV